MQNNYSDYGIIASLVVAIIGAWIGWSWSVALSLLVCLLITAINGYATTADSLEEGVEETE